MSSRKGRKSIDYIPSRKVKFAALKKERENLEFRTFLKYKADEKELDEQFAMLHRDLFAGYDCSRCWWILSM